MLGASVLIFFIVAGMLLIFMYHTPHFVIALRGYEGETNKRSSPRFSKQRQGWGEALSFLVMMPGRTVELHHVEKVWVSKNEIKVELVVIVQLLSHTWLFATPWTIARQASLPFTISQSLLNSCPLSRWCHPSISPSVVRFFSYPQSSQNQGLKVAETGEIKPQVLGFRAWGPHCHLLASTAFGGLTVPTFLLLWKLP